LLVDRQWQARAANQQPRSRFHSPLPFLVNATCLLRLLTIVYVCVWFCKGRCNRRRSRKAKIASVWGKRCRMRCRGGSDRRAVSEGQAAHCAATAAHQARALLGNALVGDCHRYTCFNFVNPLPDDFCLSKSSLIPMYHCRTLQWPWLLQYGPFSSQFTSSWSTCLEKSFAVKVQ
jgi:hypothetical protein